MKDHSTTLENIQTDIARFNMKKVLTDSTPTLPKTPIPKKTSAAATLDLGNPEQNNWFKSKLESSTDNPKLVGKIKQTLTDELARFQISVANIHPTAQTTIQKWSVDAVAKELVKLVSSDAVQIAEALRPNLSAGSSKANPDGGLKEGVQQALTLLQDQLKGQKEQIQNLQDKSANLDSLMSVMLVKEIFTDFGQAARKVLENLKIWSFLNPDKSAEIKSAAQNILDFQRGKGNFN